MIPLKQLKDIDPLDRKAEKQSDRVEYSPMDPPDAYAPPGVDDIPYEDMHSFLQQLMDDHKVCVKELALFEEVILDIQQKGVSGDVNQSLSRFFRFLDEEIVHHQLKEDKILFPRLQEKLLASEEHGHGPTPKTAVDMMEDDHIKLMQIAAVTFNFFGFAGRLPDPDSRSIVLDAAMEQAKAMIELLQLHIFREDHIVFPLALKHIATEELDKMAESLA